MANPRNFGVTAPGPFGPQSALRKGPGGAYTIEQPRVTAPGTSYADEVFKQLFDTKSPKRAQKTRTLNEKGEWVAGGSEETLRNRPDFILQAMLSADPQMRLLVKQSWDKASKEQKGILAQEIAEAFPDAQARSPGGSPLYREVMSFLRTGELSPGRMEVLRQEAELANSDPRVQRESQALPPGVSDRAVTENMDDLDSEIQFESDTQVPGDLVADGGRRPFAPPEGVDTTHLRTELDARPYLRLPERSSVQGDKINPKKERFDTGMAEGVVEPTPDEIAAHRAAWMRGKIAELSPDHPRLNELTPEFMEQVLTSRGIPIEPGMPPARRQMPVRIPQSGGTIGPQDAGRILAGEKYEKADAARVAGMERALAEEFGMDIEGVREQFQRLQETGDADALKEMQARAKIAIQRASLGPKPQKPYDSATKQSDIRAASSVAEGGEQRQLADILDQLGRGQLGSEDRLFRMLVKKGSQEVVGTPAQAGLPNAEAMADYALSLIRNPDVLGRIAANKGYDTWRQQIIDALNDRFYRQDQPPRVLTKEEAARIDAELDAQAPAETMQPGPAVSADADSVPTDSSDLFTRSSNIVAEGPGFTLLGDPRRAPGPARRNVAANDIVGSGGNVGRLGVPQGRRESQVRDSFPNGIGPDGRPMSAVEGRSPKAGRKNPGHVNSPVDRYPGSEGLENLTDASENIGSRRIAGVQISPEPGAGVLDAQASALENSIGYANQRGKVVWQDPETGNILAAYITPKMKPERVAEIRENARDLATSSGDVFDYYWPEGGLPRPDYHRWNIGQAPDAVPDGYVPPSATVAPRADQAEIDATLAAMRESDAAALQDARDYYAQFGITGEKPPGWVRRPDRVDPKTGEVTPGDIVRSRFGFADEADPNDLLNDASVIDDGAPASGANGPDSLKMLDDTAEAWARQGRTIIDADGNEIPIESASAEDLAREVSSILNNPDASDEDLKFAMEVGRGLNNAYNEIPHPTLQAHYRQAVLVPIEEAAAARRAAAQEELPDAADVVDNETAPVDMTSSAEDDMAEVGADIPDEESAPVVMQTLGDEGDAAAGAIAPQSARPDTEAAAIDTASAGMPDDVNDSLNAAATPIDDQPSGQSADNAKPQEPAKKVEAESVVNADAQKQASDAEGDAAKQQAEADAAARQAQEEAQNVRESTGVEPDQKKTWWQRTKERAYNNRGRLALGAAATVGGLWAYNGAVTSNPYPDALPSGPGPDPEPMAEMSPEDRIRAMLRSRSVPQQGASPYPVQTLWRSY